MPLFYASILGFESARGINHNSNVVAGMKKVDHVSFFTSKIVLEIHKSFGYDLSRVLLITQKFFVAQSSNILECWKIAFCKKCK